MSITRVDFEKGNFKVRETDVDSHSVTVFMRKHSNRAYKADEVAKAVKKSRWGVRTWLKKLVKMGLVTHKTPYYIAFKKNKRK